MRQIIEKEKKLLDTETGTADVAIYKIEGMRTSRRYIGQTTDPERREWEHRTHSSNRGLREALEKGDEQFDFDVIECVKGSIAYPREKYWIDCYRNRSVVNLVHGMEKVARQSSNVLVTIYKITSITDVTAYIGYTTDPESIRKIIENEGIKRFTFEVIRTDVPWAEVSTHVANEIKKHKNWAVFNREDPEKARYSHQLRIEVFCQYFDVPYDEVLAHPEKFENLMERFDDLKEDIEKSKQQVNTGLFEPDKISDPVLRAFAKRYEERKKAANAIDFLDMLIYSAHLLETDPDLHQYYRDKHRYVFVDEFQDISPIDFRLIDLFSENLFAVGDDDQAIYGFRGDNSQIMLDFHQRQDVKKYKITRNYRSTSTIVEHSKNLIEHNGKLRIGKNLRAKNSLRSPIKVLKTTKKTIKSAFLREFAEPCCQTQQTGIPVRYRSEVEKIRKMLLDRGFKEDVNTKRKEGDPFKFTGRSEAEIIEGSTIHSMKGKEYDKVILVHNTLGQDFPFHNSDDITEDRRIFYVGITRAKNNLVILGGECQFVSEAGLSVLPSKRRKHLERISKNLQSAIVKRIDIAKKQVNEVSEKLQIALTSTLIKHVESTIESIQRQCEYELDQLRQEVHKAEKAAENASRQLETELPTAMRQCEYELDQLRQEVHKAEKAAENASRQLETELPTAMKSVNKTGLEGLIPVLDEFESQIKNLPATDESNNGLDDFAVFTESVRRAHEQLLDSLKIHQLTSIESVGEIFNPTYHEKASMDIYSDEVPADRIAKEERRGYLFHDQVIRKAEVVVSKGQNIWAPTLLDRIVEIYLNRLIASKFGPKYGLDKPAIKRKMAKYLSELDDEPLKKINSAATIDATQYIKEQPLGNYCVGQATTHMCTDVVFRNFWKRMWEVVKQSRKTPNH